MSARRAERLRPLREARTPGRDAGAETTLRRSGEHAEVAPVGPERRRLGEPRPELAQLVSVHLPHLLGDHAAEQVRIHQAVARVHDVAHLHVGAEVHEQPLDRVLREVHRGAVREVAIPHLAPPRAGRWSRLPVPADERADAEPSARDLVARGCELIGSSPDREVPRDRPEDEEQRDAEAEQRRVDEGKPGAEHERCDVGRQQDARDLRSVRRARAASTRG